MSARLPRVLIAYNQPVLPPDHPDYASEADILETVAETEKVLPADRFEVQKIGYARGPQALIDRLQEWPPDVVFNLFEGEADRTETEISNAALLEWLNFSFTGSPSQAIALGRDKIRTKYLLQGAGLSTAGFQVIERLPAPAWSHPWPAIVKPATQDSSVGIDQGAVVTSQSELAARATYIFEKYGGPAIVERFIHGREFHVNLIEDPGPAPLIERLRIVPPAELRFELTREQGYWPIYSYQGKWNEDSIEFKNTPLDTGLVLPSPLRERVEEVCRAAYVLSGMRDYGRVDVRVTPDGEPFVIEVNPNPYLNSIVLVDGLAKMKRTFADLIRGLVQSALSRVRPSNLDSAGASG